MGKNLTITFAASIVRRQSSRSCLCRRHTPTSCGPIMSAKVRGRGPLVKSENTFLAYPQSLKRAVLALRDKNNQELSEAIRW
jgi:hypothetical protein